MEDINMNNNKNQNAQLKINWITLMILFGCLVALGLKLFNLI